MEWEHYTSSRETTIVGSIDLSHDGRLTVFVGAMQCAVVQELETIFHTPRIHLPACQRLLDDGSLATGRELMVVLVDEVAAQHRVSSS